MKVIRPILVTAASLLASTVPEADYPAWQVGTTYAIGERVISAATHRIYESAIGGNLGKDPAGAGAASWIDAGATNRWAMFDPAVGAATTTNEILSVTVAPAVPVDSVGFVDLIASYVRVRVMAAGAAIYDRTQRPVNGEAASTTLTFLGLPAVAGAQIIVDAVNDSGNAQDAFFSSTVQRWSDTAPVFGPVASGATAIGTMVLGTLLNLGDTEDKPKVGITDYSVRQTDDFGVTTVVERAWAKRITARSRLDDSMVDAVQRRLADIRARPVLWIGEEGFEALTVYGFYKDFNVDLQLSGVSLCSLTIEGLPTIDVDTLEFDPAPDGKSDLKVISPISVDEVVLSNSSVAENDAPAWATAATYPLGGTVLRNRRVYESLVAANLGNDPAITTGKWLDIGPANRWAMFDQALGTATTDTGAIAVTLTPSEVVSALAVLDAKAASVRVQAPGYDRTQLIVTDGTAASTVTFLDLAVPIGAAITITITGASAQSPVSVGSLILGPLRALGLVETAPTFGIKDYSTKTDDGFGNISVVQRAWAKKMALRSIVATDATGGLLRRFALLRAKPSLWIGQDGVDSLTIYGFFRDCSIEIGRSVSLCSLTIEGLSQAAQIKPAIVPTGDVAWPDVKDTDGTRPDDNATNGADPGSPLGSGTVGDYLAQVAAHEARQNQLETVTIPAINAAGAAAGQRITEARAAADLALSTIETEVERVDQRIDNISASGGYDDTAIYVEINRLDQLSLGRDAGLAESIQTVSANLETADSDLRSLAESKETAAVGRETAISQRIDQLIAQGGGGSDGVDTVARTEISRVEQASADRDTALGQSIATVQASAVLGGGNWLTNTDFLTIDGWSFGAYTPNGPVPGLVGQIDIAGADYHPVGEHVLSMVQGNPAGGGSYSEWTSTRFAVTPGSFLQFYAFYNSHRAYAQVALIWYNQAGAYVGAADAGQQPALDTGGANPANYGRIGLASVQVPATAVSAYMLLRKLDTGPGQTSSYAWFWRPYVGAARPGQNSWNPYAPGTGAAAQTVLSARLTTTESALADLPNRYATAQRASNIEASVGSVGGRVQNLETVTSNGTFATAARVSTLQVDVDGVKTTLTEQGGVINGLGVRQAAYWRVLAVAGNNRAQLTVSADANGGAGVDIIGDVAISGNLLVGGSVITGAMALNAVSQFAAAQAAAFTLTNGATSTPASVGITVTGQGFVRIDVQFDARVNAQGSTGTCRAVISRTQNGGTVNVGRFVNVALADTALPTAFWFLDSPGAGPVTYAVIFSTDAGNRIFFISTSQIAAAEFKR